MVTRSPHSAKRHSITTSLLATAATVLVANGGSLAATPDVPSQIAAIRREYAAVQGRLPRCAQRDKTVEGYSTEGGIVEEYDFRGTPQRVVASLYGCSFRSASEYELWNGQLIFVLVTRLEYNHPIGADELGPQKGVRVTQDRFYFHNGKLIRWIPANNRLPWETEPDAETQQKQLLDELANWKSAIKAKENPVTT
jgi:hypothetical protein